MAKIEYALFDMDGLIIDSERVYTEVTNGILARYGKEMTWEIKAGLMGKPERAAAQHLYDSLPGLEAVYPLEEYLVERRALQDERWKTVPLLPGAAKIIQHLHKHNIPIALATGSTRRNFTLKRGHLGHVFDCFGDKTVCGDDEGIERGKPHPDIFLLAARRLDRGVGKGDVTLESVTIAEREERAKGLVFEDGIPGVQAALSGGFQVVWVPDQQLLALGETLDKVNQISSLEQWKPEDWGLPPYDK